MIFQVINRRKHPTQFCLLGTPGLQYSESLSEVREDALDSRIQAQARSKAQTLPEDHLASRRKEVDQIEYSTLIAK
jgi:hypothetical protein